MKKSMCKKNALLVAAVVSGLAFTQSVEAANLAAIVASNYSASQMGAVQGSLINSDDIYATAGILTDLNGDTGIYNTVDQATGKSEMYMRQYTYSTTNLAPSYAFSAQGDWKTDASSGAVTNGANAHGVARSNDYVYIASYDEGTIGIGHINGSAIDDKPELTVNLKQDLTSFEGIEFDAACQFHGEAVLIEGDKLYVIANVNPQGGYQPYDPSYLMEYTIKSDGSLEYNSYVTMGKNTDSVRLNKYNNMIITNAIGGYQNYGDSVANKETSMDIAFLDPTTGSLTSSKKVTVPSNVTREMRSVKVMPNGMAYVMCYNLGTGGATINVDVYRTSVSNFVSDSPTDWTKLYSATDAAGYFGNLNAEYDTNRVWMEIGNEILVFTDGSTEPKIFKMSDFSTNASYNMVNMWTMIETDNLAGDLAKLRADNESSTNTDLLWKDNPHVTAPITQGTVTYDEEQTITVSDSKYANLTNNIMAGISGNGTTVNGTTVNLQVENDIATPVGIYAASGETVKVKADKLNIITKSANGGNSLTNAIWLDPAAAMSEQSKSAIQIEGDVNIRVDGGMGGNGIAITKTDHWGEKSTDASGETKIEIIGDVAIKGETNQDWGIEARKDNVLSRFNNTGIITKVDQSSITVDGNVDLDVYGNGIATVADGSKITVTGGGQITVPKGTKYGYYALASYGGDVSMNLGKDGKSVGSEDVTIDGDIFVVQKENASDAGVSLALATANSYLNGIIDNGSTANLYLQNGATWTNEANNTRYEQDNEDVGFGQQSHVTNFYGGASINKAGVINQTKNSKALLIDNYSGHTYINYEHDTSTPTTILGGSTYVTSAAEDSSMTLRTDSDGINVSAQDTVDAVLNALANKLYYTNYTTGEDNLDGYVQIAEGLTSASVTKKAEGNIKFDSTTGRGGLDGYTGGDLTDPDPTPTPPVVDPDPKPPVVDPDPEPPSVIPDSQDRDSFTTAIRGNDTHDKPYYYAGVLKDGVYHFTKENTTITSQGGDDDVPAGPWVSGTTPAAISAYASAYETEKSTVNIDMHGNKLTLDAEVTGISAILNGIVNVNNAGDMDILATGSGVAAALHTNGGGEIHIHNGDKGVLKLRAKSDSGSGSVIKSKNGAEGESKIIVDGLVDIVADGNDGVKTGISAVASRVEVGGGNIEATNGATAALWAYGEFVTDNAGIINVNVEKDAEGNIIGAGDRKTTITGEIATSGNMTSKGQISVGLNTADSFWEGNYADNWGYGVSPYRMGYVNLWVGNGAYWKGFTSGVMNVDLRDAGSYWQGFTTTNGVKLTIGDGAIFKNALSSTQKDSKGKQVESIFDSFTSNNGYIDMTGETIINVDASLLNKNTMLGQATPTTESKNGVTGNISIDKFSGEATVIYRHEVNATKNTVNIIGGTIKIKEAEKDSSITIRTDSDGIDLTKQLIVENTLNSLANKLYYTNYTTGERNLSGYVQIAEGLTTSTVAKKVGDIKFSETTGQGSLKSDYLTPITGDAQTDAEYSDRMVYADGVYDFFRLAELNVEGAQIDGGTGYDKVGAGISSVGAGKETVINMNKKELQLNTENKGDATGIAAVGGTVTINNAYNVIFDVHGDDEATAILANDGGTVTIDNAASQAAKVQLRAYGSELSHGAIVKAANKGQVNITGKADILADGDQGADNAILATSGGSVTVDNGTIEAKNGAKAIAADGGTVNVSVKLDDSGAATGAGMKVTTVKGDIATSADGTVNLGLSGSRASWTGDYTSSSDDSAFNLWLNNNATWTGNSTTDDMNLTMLLNSKWNGNNTGDDMNLSLTNGSKWTGYNTGDNMNLSLTQSATWTGYSTGDNLALTLDNSTWTNTLNTTEKNKVAKLKTTNGVLNMTTDGASDVVIDNYNGDMKVFYNHEVTEDDKVDILGGDVTIKEAGKDSSITLITDRTGISLNSYDMVSDALDSLANKLYYTNYTKGERNLSGYVQIAEGLTTSSATKALGDIKFSETTGQGSVNTDTIDGVLPEHQIKDEFEDPITGDSGKDTAYEKSGVLRDGTYEFESENTKIDVKDVIVTGYGSAGITGGVASTAKDKGTLINLNSNNLDIVSDSTGRSAGIVASNGVVTINDIGNLSITVTGANTQYIDWMTVKTKPSYGIYAYSGAVNIHNGDGNALKICVETTGTGDDSKILHAEYAATIAIDGMVDIVGDYEKGVDTVINSLGSTIDIGGGNIEAKNGATAIYSETSWLYGGDGVVNVNVTKDEDGNIVGAGDRTTTITGDFRARNGGNINVGLNGKDSFWEGNHINSATGVGIIDGTTNLWVTNGAHWKGYTDGSVNLDLSGEGSYWQGTSVSDAMNLKLTDGATWYNALSAEMGKDSIIGSFVGDKGYIDMTGANVFTLGSDGTLSESTNGVTGNLVINQYSGNTTLIYRHEIASNDEDGILLLADENSTVDVTDNTNVNIIGGNVTIKSANEGSSITLRTNNDGIDMYDDDMVANTLNALANKLYYEGYVGTEDAEGERNLNGYAEIAEGLTTSSIGKKLGDILFSEDGGQGSIDVDSIRDINKTPGVIYGDSETAMMRGAKSAMASTAMIWRSESDDMMKRLGEIRNGNGESGIWAKYYAGKSEMDAQKAKFKTEYTAYQLGYDKQIGDWLLGAAFSYNDGESTYQLGGKGDNTVASLSLYGTKKASNGTYLDLVAKFGRLDTDFTVYNDMLHKLTGDYDTWGVSASAEYGKRFEQSNGFYIDPSVQLTIGRVQGKDYTAASDFLDVHGKYKNMYVHQDSMNSIVGKLGIGVGQKTDRANYFAKFAVAHEFAGDFDTNFRADGEAGGNTNIDFGGSWCELELGGGILLNDTTMLYATYERSFGGDVKEKYRIDGGIRFSF